MATMATSPTMDARRRFTGTHEALTQDRPHPSPLASHPSTFRPQSFTDLDLPQSRGSLIRPKSAYNLTTTRTSYMGGDLHDSLLLGERTRPYRGQDDIAALVDFFRNHEPPPGNFMSMPYEDDDDDERGRWGKLRKIAKRRSKSVSRIQQPIRLPDSAVSGTTTGGHRHIAISIPLEAEPFGEEERSQYPVFANGEEPLPPASPVSKDPIRTFVNEKGVVTVLRAVAEDYEVNPPLSPLSSHPPFSQGFTSQPKKESPPSTRPVSRQPSKHSQSSSLSGQQRDSQIRTNKPLPPLSLSDRPMLQNRSVSASSVSQEQHRRSTSSGAQSQREFTRSAYPARGSSMAASRGAHHQSSSIDSIIAQQPFQRHASSSSQDEPPPQRRSMPKRSGTRDGPPVSFSPLSLSKSTPALNVEYQTAEKQQLSKNLKVKIITNSPVVTQDDSSPSTTPLSAVSRRDKVRDKKRRDMEAAKKARESQGRNRESTDCDQEPEEPVEQVAKAIAQRTEPRQSTSMPTLCPIVVVADFEPAGVPEAVSKEEEEEEDSTATQQQQAWPEQMIPDPSPEPSELDLNETGTLVLTGNPTPPESANNSPAQKFGFDDRTSLTRRREWTALREQDRKRRQLAAASSRQHKARQQQQHHHHHHHPHPQHQHQYQHHQQHQNQQQQQRSVVTPTYDDSSVDAELEIIRLYEAYRDHRMLDMDRRLRRLERNGDVWVKAIVPLLDNMNHTMTDMNARQEEEVQRDSRSQDQMRPKHHNNVHFESEERRVARAASLSHGRKLAEKARQVNSSSWDDSDETQMEDTTGLGAMEPLMRDLVGDSRIRQEAPPRIRNGGALRVR